MSRMFREGYQAAMDGLCSCTNPHTICSLSWWQWVDGFNRGNAVKRRATMH